MKRLLSVLCVLAAWWALSAEAAKPKDLSFSCALAAGGTTCLEDYPIAGGNNDGFTGVAALADGDSAKVFVHSATPMICDYTFKADSTTATGTGDCPSAVRGGGYSSAGVWLLASYTVKGLTVARVAGSASATDFYEVPANGDNKVTLKAADSLGADYTVTLPSVTGTLVVSSGALGTPSFTALNAPSADANPGTTAGQISHDSSDTNADTAARGVLKYYDGTGVRTLIDSGTNYVTIIRTEFIPVAYMVDGAAAPAAIATHGATKYRDFAHDSTKDLKFMWVAPLELVGTTVKVRAIALVSASTAPADTEGVSWGISAASSGTSDPDDPSRGTVVYSEDADLDNDCNAQYDYCFFPYVEVTPTDLAAGEMVAFTVNRKHDDSDDDYAQLIGLVGVEIKYKTKLLLTDAW